MGRSNIAAGLVMISIVLTATFCAKKDVGDQEDEYVFTEIYVPRPIQVDLLLVIDSSPSMALEQQWGLAERIEDAIQELISPIDRGPETRPVFEDLHVGIITGDMGTAGHSVDTCENPSHGEDGVLRNSGNGEDCDRSYSSPDCGRDECPWLAHSDDVPDDGSDPDVPPLWEDAACIANVGASGCLFQQPLEASLRALTVHAEPGGPNEGFLRDDSLIVVFYITDGDDCSAEDISIFDPDRDDLGAPGEVRCAMNEDMLYPLSRYYEAFSSLRPDSPDLVVIGAIAGIPAPRDGTWLPGDSIEALRDLQQVNPVNPNELAPTCQTGTGNASPPVRLAEFVYMFGYNGVLASICQGDWVPAFRAIGRCHGCPIDTRVCLDPTTLPTGDPRQCRVIELLHNDGDCPHPADLSGPERTNGWHVDLGLDEEGRRQCEILTADYDGDGCPDGISREECEMWEFGSSSGALQGWFYMEDDYSCVFGRILFTNSDVVSDTSDALLACRSYQCPEERQCPDAVMDAPRCNPFEASACDTTSTDDVCVLFISGEICGWDDDGLPRLCARCVPTVGDLCAEADLEWLDEPVLGFRGCCHEGFHCEEGSGCVPDASLRCE